MKGSNRAALGVECGRLTELTELTTVLLFQPQPFMFPRRLSKWEIGDELKEFLGDSNLSLYVLDNV